MLSCSASSFLSSSFFLKRVAFIYVVSRAISSLVASYSLSFANMLSFSFWNLSSSILSLSFNSLSYLKSSYKFLLTTFLIELTSSNFLFKSSANPSWYLNLLEISLFSWVAYSSSERTRFKRFIKLYLSCSSITIWSSYCWWA